MSIFKEGDKGKAVCEDCRAVVSTTFQRRDVPFSDGRGIVRNILVGVCDQCGGTVSIPAQSTPAVGRARKAAAASIEANLPAIYIDMLDRAIHAIDPQASTDFRRTLLVYFVHKAAHDDAGADRIRALYEKVQTRYPEQRGGARRRLSMKIPGRVTEDFRLLERRTALNTTELLKGVVAQIQQRVIERPRLGLMEELKTLSAISA